MLCNSSDVPTAREAIIDAFRRLEERTGRSTFRLKDVAAEVQAITSEFQEATIRTYITSVMCADAPVHHANHTDDLRRVGHGQYQRLETAGNGPALPSTAPARDPSPADTDDAPSREWHWEGEVQGSIVGYLARSGWTILAVADTEARAHGTDIVASRDGHRLLVEVKGYPSEVYVRGPRMGQKKPTLPATQARVWFATALMTALMLRDDNAESAVAIGLPDFTTYRSLADRVARSLERLGVHVIWVHEDGGVSSSSRSAGIDSA